MAVVIGPASAKPRYKPHGHGHKHAYSAFLLSATGSASWDVTEQRSDGSGDSWTYDEGSTSQWRYGVPTHNAQASGFAVTWPVPCIEIRQLPIPCPSPSITAVGPGPVELDMKINDTATGGSPPMTGTLQCNHAAGGESPGGISLAATFIKHTDSYRISIGIAPQLAAQVTEDEASCPDANGVTKLDAWGPGALPSGSVPHWFDVRSVTIPASVLAGSNSIDFPVSLQERNKPPADCGITQPPGETVTCHVSDSWRGVVTLHRRG